MHCIFSLFVALSILVRYSFCNSHTQNTVSSCRVSGIWQQHTGLRANAALQSASNQRKAFHERTAARSLASGIVSCCRRVGGSVRMGRSQCGGRNAHRRPPGHHRHHRARGSVPSGMYSCYHSCVARLLFHSCYHSCLRWSSGQRPYRYVPGALVTAGTPLEACAPAGEPAQEPQNLGTLELGKSDDALCSLSLLLLLAPLLFHCCYFSSDYCFCCYSSCNYSCRVPVVLLCNSTPATTPVALLTLPLLLLLFSLLTVPVSLLLLYSWCLQVTFVPPEEPPAPYGVPLSLPGIRCTLYSHSFLGLGQVGFGWFRI